MGQRLLPCLAIAAASAAGCYDLSISGESDASFLPSLDLRHDFLFQTTVYERVSLFRRAPVETRDEPGTFRLGVVGFRGPATFELDGAVEGQGYLYDEPGAGMLEGAVVRGCAGGRINTGTDAVDFAFLAGMSFVTTRLAYDFAGASRLEDCHGISLDVGLDLRFRLAPALRLVFEGYGGLNMVGVLRGGGADWLADGRIGLDWEIATGAGLFAGWRWMRLSADRYDGNNVEQIETEMSFAVSGPTAGLSFRF